MYVPNEKILEKYADVLVNFALGGGKGVKKGEVVFLQVPEVKIMLMVLNHCSVLIFNNRGGIMYRVLLKNFRENPL